MIQLLAPFLLNDIEQVPVSLLKQGIGLEGNLFDANELKHDSTWKLIASNLDKIQDSYGDMVKTLHFPVENANYLESSEVKDYLYKFIDICRKHKIEILTLHSNYIQKTEDFKIKNISEIRKRYLKIFREIDLYLEGGNVRIGVENLPIIGDKGTDFDSVFVFPEDFENFSFRNIFITWDFGHWAYTTFVAKSLANFSNMISVSDIKFTDFEKVTEKIIACHFSSFKGTTYPYSNSECHEGVVPEKGDFNQKMLINAVKYFKDLDRKVYFTLEIKEENYLKRKNIYQAVEWFGKI